MSVKLTIIVHAENRAKAANWATCAVNGLRYGTDMINSHRPGANLFAELVQVGTPSPVETDTQPVDLRMCKRGDSLALRDGGGATYIDDQGLDVLRPHIIAVDGSGAYSERSHSGRVTELGERDGDVIKVLS